MKVEMKPEIIFSRRAFYRMMEYCRQAKGEITGFGTVEETPSGLFVSEVYIVPQKASPAGVLVNQQSLMEFMKWAREIGRPELTSSARLWWHSHAEFDVFRSNTDNTTIEMLLGVMPYVMAVVGNHASKYECSLHYKNPRLSMTDLKIKVEDFDVAAKQGQVAQDITEMVSEWKHEHKPEPEVVVTSPGHASGLWDRYPKEAPIEAVDSERSFLAMSDAEWERWSKKQDVRNIDVKCINSDCSVYTSSETGECKLCRDKRDFGERETGVI